MEWRCAALNETKREFTASVFSNDGILLVDALDHFLMLKRIVDERLRVLNPDGHLLIEEQDIRQPLIMLVSMAEKAVGLQSLLLTLRQIKARFDPALFRLYVKNPLSQRSWTGNQACLRPLSLTTND